ncbi:hypothetical protein [Paraburkholderia sp. C35]|uniref:hypothetical protein n=1 Tax=Paraburkholderia sp. C35 TaxID=2126993 RepID=UPI000D6A0118|nr:hypothetical protein [Paraburkholderia sp. C35]
MSGFPDAHTVARVRVLYEEIDKSESEESALRAAIKKAQADLATLEMARVDKERERAQLMRAMDLIPDNNGYYERRDEFVRLLIAQSIVNPLAMVSNKGEK